MPQLLPVWQNSPVTTLMFDLGGVLYAIDLSRSISAFQKLLPEGGNFPDQGNVLAHPGFRQLEVGAVSPAEFRAGLRDAFLLNGSDEALDEAWKALLIGPIAGRVEILEALKPHFRLILLSNTNAIHYKALVPETEEILDLFDAIYLSHELGLHKPKPEIYERVMDLENCRAEQLFFIEDSAENLESARVLGIKGCLVQQNTDPLHKIFFQ